MQKAIDYKILAKQYIDRQLNGLVGTARNTSIEPYKPVKNTGTIRTEDWAIYAAESGSGEVRMALWLARANNPELTKLMPEIYTIARHSRKLAEEDRDQSGLQQTKVNIPQNHEPQKNGYKSNPYSYVPYSKGKIYLKSALKKVYSGIEEEVKKLFSKMRSIYQSSSGVIRDRKRYEGRNEPTKDNVLSLDAYRKARERRAYNPPQGTLEERLERAA